MTSHTKFCNKCLINKCVTEYYIRKNKWKNNGYTESLRYACKDCFKKTYLENKEIILEKNRNYQKDYRLKQKEIKIFYKILLCV